VMIEFINWGMYVWRVSSNVQIIARYVITGFVNNVIWAIN